ncbi:MAG TPA: TetR/AcrR family transcriptional regulator [Chitinophagaceae bacterium]|nr:TetR/AcrR family transcriptional regulator [Chitinophagaceae bacterium]
MSPRSKKSNEEIRNASKQTIADSALALFIHEGYLNVTIDQIAKNAGVSKGLMYNYFSGKEELLSFIIERIMTEVSALGEIILAEKDPVNKMKVMLTTTFKLLREKGDFWKTIMPVITQKAISEKMEEGLKAIFVSVTKDMKHMFKACGVRNPELEAYQLGALLDGIAWHYFFLFEDSYPLKKMEKELIRKYTKLLENGE